MQYCLVGAGPGTSMSLSSRLSVVYDNNADINATSRMSLELKGILSPLLVSLLSLRRVIVT
jgi:hypothetical protein